MDVSPPTGRWGSRMLVLPLIVMFLGIFVVGLVRDWRADVVDESRRGGWTWLLLPVVAVWRSLVALGETFGRSRSNVPSTAPYPPYPLESGVAASDNAIDVGTAARPS
ncbi:MAG: hypothetical protein ACQSGP_00220 [Frankia sp.]